MKKFDIIINGVDILEKSIGLIQNDIDALNDKMPELRRKDKWKASIVGLSTFVVVMLISFSIIILIGFFGVRFDNNYWDENFKTTFIILLVMMLGILFVLAVVFSNLIKKKNVIGELSRDTQNQIESLKGCVKFVEAQIEGCNTLLNEKNNLVDVQIKHIENNFYSLEYYYSQDGDKVETKDIVIDHIERSLKQKGASLVISEKTEWIKKFEVTLFIENELMKTISK